MNELENIFKQIFHQFSDETVAMFTEGFTMQELKKGDYFLREGKRCNHIAFIASGAMMCHYIKDGKRFIDEFSLDNEFITDYSSFLTHSPSNKYIQCLENCKFYVISNDSLNDLYQVKSTDFERLGRVMAEQLYLQWHEKSKSLLMDNATERYLKLIQNRTELPAHAFIAEYAKDEVIGKKLWDYTNRELELNFL